MTGVTSFFLHILAMVCMLCDHLWGTVIPGNEWLTCIGRVAFPIFAFMTVEGYFHTANLKKYLLRLLLFAVLSEIPFNLAIGGRMFYPLHQNVLWSFLISLGLIHWNERAKASGKMGKRILVIFASLILAFLGGLITFVDYYHAGILTVLAFYYFRGNTWYHRAAQLAALMYINLEILGGLVYPVNLFGYGLEIPQQGFALLALIPIWLYRGEQGYYNRYIRLLYYGFYPAHLLILGLLKWIM
jgi:hypothetical protein